MRRNRVKVMVVGVVLLLCSSPVIAELRFDDGGIHNIDYAISDYVVVDLETTVNVLPGARLDWLEGYGESIINVSGGWMDILISFGNSQANISGGSMSALAALGNSHINIFGGAVVDGLYVDENGIMTIHGSAFAVGGTPVGYTELTGFLTGQLTGTLRSGDPINAYFEIYNNGKMVLVPEPATLILFGLGGFTMLRKRTQI